MPSLPRDDQARCEPLLTRPGLVLLLRFFLHRSSACVARSNRRMHSLWFTISSAAHRVRTLARGEPVFPASFSFGLGDPRFTCCMSINAGILRWDLILLPPCIGGTSGKFTMTKGDLNVGRSGPP